MPRIARLIIYEANDEVLTNQLKKSLSEGIYSLGHINITIINLSSNPINDFINNISKKLKQKEFYESY